MFNKDGLISTNPSPHSPHQIIPSLIKPGKTVLDVGCNTGMLGKKLYQQNTLDGIDINSQALNKAKAFYRALYCLDLSQTQNLKLKNKYDYLVFSDILEHLPRPDLILLKLKKYLKPNGIIISSLPNIGRFETRLQLALGNFEYTDGGVLSQDHLRFFNKRSGRQLFENCGFTVTQIIPTGLGHSLKIFPNLLSFQFIYVAKNNNAKEIKR